MASERPLPRPDDASQQYWQGCRDGELRMQRCTPCGHLRFPPRPMCPRCQSFECGWVPVSGRGTVYSWVVAHPPLLPAFVDLAPLVVLLVELEEGTRIVANLAGCRAEDLHIGMKVECRVENADETVKLPFFYPVS